MNAERDHRQRQRRRRCPGPPVSGGAAREARDTGPAPTRRFADVEDCAKRVMDAGASGFRPLHCMLCGQPVTGLGMGISHAVALQDDTGGAAVMVILLTMCDAHQPGELAEWGQDVLAEAMRKADHAWH